MDVLSARALNRAALDRQMLLRRADLPALDAVRRLVALQAQDANIPYLTLWSRLRGFTPDDLTVLLNDRSVVRSSVLRATQHMCAADDFLWIRPLVQPAVLRSRQAAFGRTTRVWDLDELATAATELLDGRTLTRPELARRLQERWPDRDRQALGWSVQYLLPVVHPPPSGTWNTWGATPFARAEDWIGAPLVPSPPVEELIHRYLAAFGPASVKDFQMWSGVRDAAPHFTNLRTYQDENGTELFDLDVPLPAPDTPAPPRFLPDLDNLLLAYHDRTRVMTSEQRKEICVGAWVKATLLVDGRVRGVWTAKRDKKTDHLTLTIALLDPLTPDEHTQVDPEAEALAKFLTPGPHDIRYTPYTP